MRVAPLGTIIANNDICIALVHIITKNMFGGVPGNPVTSKSKRSGINQKGGIIGK